MSADDKDWPRLGKYCPRVTEVKRDVRHQAVSSHIQRNQSSTERSADVIDVRILPAAESSRYILVDDAVAFPGRKSQRYPYQKCPFPWCFG